MFYRVSEIDPADGGYGFNIIGDHSIPLVHFCYASAQDAIAAAKQVRVAIRKAKTVQPQAR